MNKHTPGPWRMRTHDLMQRIETCEGHTVAIPAMNDGVPALSCSANARLIAQAPELLASLRRVLRMLEIHDPRLANFGEVEEARSIISRAEGAPYWGK